MKTISCIPGGDVFVSRIRRVSRLGGRFVRLERGPGLEDPSLGRFVRDPVRVELRGAFCGLPHEFARRVGVLHRFPGSEGQLGALAVAVVRQECGHRLLGAVGDRGSKLVATGDPPVGEVAQTVELGSPELLAEEDDRAATSGQVAQLLDLAEEGTFSVGADAAGSEDAPLGCGFHQLDPCTEGQGLHHPVDGLRIRLLLFEVGAGEDDPNAEDRLDRDVRAGCAQSHLDRHRDARASASDRTEPGLAHGFTELLQQGAVPTEHLGRLLRRAGRSEDSDQRPATALHGDRGLHRLLVEGCRSGLPHVEDLRISRAEPGIVSVFAHSSLQRVLYEEFGALSALISKDVRRFHGLRSTHRASDADI